MVRRWDLAMVKKEIACASLCEIRDLCEISDLCEVVYARLAYVEDALGGFIYAAN
jgi:hypothetical protein